MLEKDLRIELRSGEVLTTSSFFALLVVVTTSIGLYDGSVPGRTLAPSVMWLALAFATVLAVGKSWQREREDAALETLLVTPLSRSALFAGKALALAFFVTVVQLVVVPATALLFNVDLLEHGVAIAVVSLLAIPGLASTGSLFGSMTVRTGARELLLAIVLFPLLSPTLISAIAATRAALSGAPLAELSDYLRLLGVFDALFVVGGLSLFGPLIDG